MNENTQEIMETVQADSGEFTDSSVYTGLFDTGDSNGDSTQTTVFDADGNPISPNVWTDNLYTGADSVSSGDILLDSPYSTEELMALQEAVAESDTQIIESLSAIHSVLVLIFAFLLFEWTEKKLKVTVNRFTDKRR